MDTFIATDSLKGSDKVGRDSYLTLRLEHSSSAILRLDLKDYRARADGFGEEFLELFEGGLAEMLQIETDAKFGWSGAFADVFEAARLLQGKARAGFFDLNAYFQKERRAGLQNVFEAGETFGKSEEFLYTSHVLKRKDGPASALSGAHGTGANDESSHGNFFAISLTFHFGEGQHTEVLET